jgi:sugar phosphate isomerase/epimerase
MPMKISAYMGCFSMYIPEKAIEVIAKLGFKALDLLSVRPHLFYPHDYTKDELKPMVQLIDSYELKVAAVATSDGTAHTSNLTVPNEKVRRWNINHLKASAELASMFDCTLLTTDAGYYSPIGSTKEKEWHWAKEGLTEAAKTCSDYGVTIALEAGPGTILHDSRDGIRMIEEVNHENLRALLDVGHAMITFHNFWREAGPHPVDAVYDLKKYLVHTHIQDNQGLLDEHLIPGKGVIDFQVIIDALYDIGYNGYLTLEPNVRDPIKGFKEGKRFLEKLLSTH